MKKITYSLVAFIITLILFEILLQLFSLITNQHYSPKRIDTNQNEGITISCLGESTTAFGGEDSYPSQLQTFLSDHNITVINRGIPGATTQQILNRLGKILEEDKPDIVIFMIGINDFDSERWLKPLGFLSHLKLARIISWIYFSLKSEEISEDTFLGPKSREFHLDIIRRFRSDRNVPHDQVLESLLTLSMENEFLSLLKRESQKRNVSLGPYADILHDYFEGKDVTNQAFLYGITQLFFDHMSVLSYDQVRSYLWWYPKIIQSLENAQRDQSPLRTLFQKSKSRLEQLFPSQSRALIKEIEDFSRKSYTVKKSDNIRQLLSTVGSRINHQKIVRLILKSGAMPVAMQYPTRDPRQLKRFYGSSVKYYISNQNIQDQVNVQGFQSIFKDSFAGDFGHATQIGNYLIAKNAYDVVINIIDNLQKK